MSDSLAPAVSDKNGLDSVRPLDDNAASAAELRPSPPFASTSPVSPRWGGPRDSARSSVRRELGMELEQAARLGRRR